MSDTVTMFVVNAVIAFSGWASFAYERFTYKPRIRGKVFQILQGQVERDGTPLTTYFTFLHLTNARHNAVTILDYQMEVRIDGSWQKLMRPYGVPAAELHFTDTQGASITIPDLAEQMIYSKGSSLEFGRPLQGWILFVGDASFASKRPSMYRVTCRDEFDVQHVIRTAPESFENVGLLSELTHLQITPGLVGRTSAP